MLIFFMEFADSEVLERARIVSTPHKAIRFMQILKKWLGLGAIATLFKKNGPHQEPIDEQNFKNLFENVPVAISKLSESGQFILMNSTCADFFGYSKEELTNMSMTDLTYFEANKEESEQQVHHQFEKRYIHKTGTIIWARVTSQRIQSIGSPDHFLKVFEDITQKKNREHLTDVLLETMNEGLVVWDSSNHVHTFNTAALTMLGLNEDQLLGRTPYDPRWQPVRENGDPFPAEELPASITLRTGEKVNGVVVGIKLTDETTRWLRINSTPLFFDHTKKEQYALTTFSDVTELIISKNENRFILDALQIGVWKFDPIKQTLLWDESMYRLFDVKKQDFSGDYQAWESALTPSAKEKAVAELGSALSGEKDFDTVFEIETKSKGKRYIAGRGKVIRDADGKPLMMFGVNTDVTNQAQAEMEKEKTSKFLELILKNIPSMIFVKEYKKDLTFSLLNKSGEKLLGLKQEQVLGKNHFNFLPHDKAAQLMKSDINIFDKNEISKLPPVEIETPSGKKIIETVQVPVFDQQGNPELIVGISNDITEEVQSRIALERERAKNLQTAKLASLGEMSAGVAHEINNPLAIICGAISILKKFKDDPVRFEAKTESILKASRRIEKIVNGLRKFSRSTDSVPHTPKALIDIAREAVVMTETKVNRQSTDIEVINISDRKILCDEIEIEQVLINLINNAVDAIQFLKEKWIKINIFSDGDFIVLQVVDSGSGISTEIEEKLFQPFFTTKPVGQGTGLGLSITSGILAAHGATIQLNREFNNTCFEIRFKVAALQEISNAS